MVFQGGTKGVYGFIAGFDEFYRAGPILNRHAVCETPKIGREVVIMASRYHRSKRTTAISESFPVIAAVGMVRVDVQSVQEPEVTVLCLMRCPTQIC